MEGFVTWLVSVAPVAAGVAVAAIPGVIVAIISEILARRRESRVITRDAKRNFSVALQGVAGALADLAEVRANPSRNAGRNGEVSARFRVALATAELSKCPTSEPLLAWLKHVADRINVADAAWVDLDRLGQHLIDPIALWQEGSLSPDWFRDRLTMQPVRPQKPEVKTT
ncbi:hypothetical protein [Leifsonia xyli]|uniref:hypothetical protein n=1 Tax=Leifsonia xyli TaxID=1575 RepID=UPI003D66BC75